MPIRKNLNTKPMIGPGIMTSYQEELRLDRPRTAIKAPLTNNRARIIDLRNKHLLQRLRLGPAGSGYHGKHPASLI
jgi:hypothetical protein